jgi:hypothetical protein
VAGSSRSARISRRSTTPGDGEEFKNAIAYLDGEMAGSVLAAFTELPSAAQLGRGSYALAESATDFFLESRMATLTEMGESLTSWVIADLVRYNFGDGAAVPTFTFKPPAQDSTEKAIEMLQSLATAQAPTAVPHEFIDLLTEKVAGYFNIDVSQVHDAIRQSSGGRTEGPVPPATGRGGPAPSDRPSAGRGGSGGGVSNVYVVLESTERWTQVIAVYQSREAADKRAEEENGHAEFRHDFEVEEHPLHGSQPDPD